jgi:hypothetical protein
MGIPAIILALMVSKQMQAQLATNPD